MRSSQALVTALKAELRRAGITYAELARELGLAESSVKRIFARGDMTLARIDEVLAVLRLDFAELARQVAQATPPRRELTEAQVEAVLDKYTVGKVPFTMKGYQAIVPDLTAAEATTILGYLKEARERAIDFKNMNQISVIFEIYKTKSEQFLISNGRNWRVLYKSYTDSLKAKKAADAAAKAATTSR
jgi:transcriptional regulator with XRE-family HTH domain